MGKLELPVVDDSQLQTEERCQVWSYFHCRPSSRSGPQYGAFVYRCLTKEVQLMRVSPRPL